MKQLILAIAAAMALMVCGRGATDENKPYGRVCVALKDATTTPPREQPWRVDMECGPGRTLVAYADAAEKCRVLIAPLQLDGKLVPGWRPAIAELSAEFEEATLPAAPAEWRWAIKPPQPFEIYVIFLPADVTGSEELGKLIAAMNKASDEKVLALQTNKLRELIGGIIGNVPKSELTAKTEGEIGGVFRGSAFPWKQFAKTVNFGEGRPGIIILPGRVGPEGFRTP